MVFKFILSIASACLMVVSFNINATLINFEFSGLAHESSPGINIPWGSFAGGIITYDTNSVESTSGCNGYCFSAPPVEFTFEIYRNSNKVILVALEAGQVEGSVPDMNIRVNNGGGSSGFDAISYDGYNAMSFMELSGQPAYTKFSLELSGYGVLSSSALPDYIPDISLFTANQPQIAAWAVDATNGNLRHLFTVRNLSFSPITAVPLPSSLLLMISGVVMLIALQRKKTYEKGWQRSLSGHEYQKE